MVKQVPLAVKFHDGMVAGPAHNRVQQNAFVRERTIRIVANRIADVLRIAGAVREVVVTAKLVHPRSFKKTAVVVSLQERVAFFINDHHIFWCFGKLQKVIRQFCHFGAERRLVIGR